MDEENDVSNSESFPGDASNDNVEPSGDEENVSNPQAPNALTLDELNSLTGRKYQTKEDALKSIGDTFKFVGKKEKPVDTSKFVSREQYEQDMFYSQHPEYQDAAIKKIIQSMAVADKKPVQDVVQSDEFKSIFESRQRDSESQKMKTVLESSPRIASSNDKLQKLKEAVDTGNIRDKDKLAFDALKDAYPDVF